MKRALIKYAKRGEAALLSHRETMRSLERALRRSGLPLVFTSGYNPRPRMSFSPALPLGIQAEAEYLEVSFDGETDLEAAMQVMNSALPKGLSIIDIQELTASMPKLSKWTRYGLYRVPGDVGEVFLLLALAGGKQARLKDALASLWQRLGLPIGSELRGISRVGLYASDEEVFEDAGDSVYYFDGELGELEVLTNSV